jgi:hypothetical protein
MRCCSLPMRPASLPNLAACLSARLLEHSPHLHSSAAGLSCYKPVPFDATQTNPRSCLQLPLVLLKNRTGPQLCPHLQCCQLLWQGIQRQQELQRTEAAHLQAARLNAASGRWQVWLCRCSSNT